MLATFVYLATFIDVFFGRRGDLVEGLMGRILNVLCWTVYCACAGSVGTGVWVIAHECGSPMPCCSSLVVRLRIMLIPSLPFNNPQADIKPTQQARPSTTPSDGYSTLLSSSLITAGESA